MQEMSYFLDVKLKEIRDRVTELRPLVDEFHRLEAADQALNGVDEPAQAKPRAARPRSAGASKPRTGRRGRPKGSGTRAQQALDAVRAQPDITIAELATAMGVQPSYLYRVMPDLAQQGLVTKSGRGWHVRKRPGDSPDDAGSVSGS